jgi:hypothetical protein
VFNSRCAVFQRLTAFNPHFMGFKHLTAFGVQMLMSGILKRRKRLNAERSEVPIPGEIRCAYFTGQAIYSIYSIYSIESIN